MSKTNISVATIGHMPSEFDKRKIGLWRSEIFSIAGDIENYSLTEDSDGYGWEFSDERLEQLLPEQFNGDFLIAIVNVPIELNWYSRRLSKNRVVFTFHEIKEILDHFNIPLENAVFRLLYAYTFLYKRSGDQIPLNDVPTNFAHDETRGCLFDMNGIKTDIVYSLHEPIICSDCIERLRKEKVANETIDKAQKEIIRIKKPLFYRIVSFVKKHPIWSLFISAVSAVFLGAIGSYIATVIYELTNPAL
ncbi:hypothetical protein Tel_17095 (plasmid) [Candidatus Tenderia electrophaga]|jgi:hypothetical protein|uniref:Uncharacterized protein n=1 Tax=Candidatus Tenderia electrophaga TaxID=1748243 RepID=A0A0S2TIJ0_9GAMM|nr:hypothetical protein Tel_17095 [Candidatus Tenderia electrophaga]